MNDVPQSPPRAAGALDCGSLLPLSLLQPAAGAHGVARPWWGVHLNLSGFLSIPRRVLRPLALAAAGLLFPLLFAGCLPVERIWWSPEGERALVLLDDGLRLVDGQGRTLLAAGAGSDAAADAPPAYAAAAAFETRSVLWLPGETGIVWLEKGRFGSWDELHPLLPVDEASHVERLAAALPGLASALFAFVSDSAASSAGERDGERVGDTAGEGDGSGTLSLESMLAAVPEGDRGAKKAAFALSLRREANAWAALAAQPGRLAPDLRRALASPPEFLLHRLREGRVEDLLRPSTGPERGDSSTQGAQADDPRGFAAATGRDGVRTLAASLDRLHPPQLSPCGGFLLWGREISSEGEVLRLELHALGGEGSRVLHEGGHAAYAWAPDGGSIHFLAPVWGAPSLLRQLKRLALPTVDAPQGSVVEEPETLAVAVMPFLPALATLPDGSVLFSGQTVAFPLDPDFLFEESSFFLLDPASRETRRVPTPPGALPTNLGHFVLCPAGERVAVVESDSDALAVVTLATGQVELVSPPQRGWKCRTLPSWRSAEELSYAAVEPTSGRVRWMRWSSDSGSSPVPGPQEESWTPERTAAWMDYREPTSQDPAPASER